MSACLSIIAAKKYLQSFLKAFKFMDAWYVFFLQDCKNMNFIAEVRFFFSTGVYWLLEELQFVATPLG